MSLRNSPSGPNVTGAGAKLYFFSTEPAAAGTGLASRWLNDFNAIADPMTILSSAEDAALVALPEALEISSYSVQRRPGAAGTDPSGADVTFQLQIWDAATKTQTDVVGATLVFGPAEFTAKSVNVVATVPVGSYLVARSTYAVGWTREDRQIQNYHTINLAQTRNSPSGPALANSRQMDRWFCSGESNSVAVSSSIALLGEADTNIQANPVTTLGGLNDAALVVATTPRQLSKFLVDWQPRLAGIAGAGDSDITFELKTWDPDTDTEAAIPGTLLSFATGGDYRTQSVNLNAQIPIGLYYFVRAVFPTNWLQGTRAEVGFCRLF